MLNVKQLHYNTLSTYLTDYWNILTRKDGKHAVRSEKRNFKKNIAQKDKKSLASYIKSKTKSRTNVRPLSAGSEMISNNEEMAMI